MNSGQGTGNFLRPDRLVRILHRRIRDAVCQYFRQDHRVPMLITDALQLGVDLFT